jgi:hypothetical protein
MMMNESIRELAEKAGFMDSLFSESGDDCETEIKAFAELIVNECCDVVINSDPSPKMILQEPYRTIMINIQEHFGVVDE